MVGQEEIGAADDVSDDHTVIGVVVQPTAADHVWIQNQMGETLEVHCMSGDDDLGWQILANGQIYGFGNTYK